MSRCPALPCLTPARPIPDTVCLCLHLRPLLAQSVSIPQSSPSGTLSTIHSATTASVAGSPGQQRQAAHSIFRDPPSPQHGQDDGASGRLSLAGGIAPATSSAAAAAAAAADEAGRSSGSGDGGAGPAAAGDWQGAADAADQEQRRLYSQHLGEQRREWEQQLQAELQTQQAAVQEQHQQQLYYWAMQLEQHERDAAEQLKSAQDARLQELRSELQVGWARRGTRGGGAWAASAWRVPTPLQLCLLCRRAL